jgi:hypothetical protein
MEVYATNNTYDKQSLVVNTSYFWEQGTTLKHSEEESKKNDTITEVNTPRTKNGT